MPTRSAVQSGFTLIELMVVVVIMAVVVSVGMMSLGSNEQATLRAQDRNVKSLLMAVRDQAALKQRLYLVGVDESGLTTYSQNRGEWQVDDKIKRLKWPESLIVEWKIDNQTFVKQQNLPQEGWVFWPSGDVLAGSIILRNLDNQAFDRDQEATEYAIRWNGLLQFEKEVKGSL
ncbi:MAG: prepilin-type N-terminal cleavage/methylation domain-containing protein [Thiomicrorhabdus chilensis]|uniref:prepilin-type N-terminal cleavage/methylation domain-containing protein n=1 Tax=Thiomicrorhabdus chilensis TaxID=63656 RepID=UPI00299D39EE|nr:prepilin-type N-terminal cleavage/methylation domain-containing protein [Thiomicrorhabdus chilensis]MDX1347653.1 prepilin-type N-terminal cleavage/methylation domain-containing protein [Thiomicrorhabdus chilensis]